MAVMKKVAKPPQAALAKTRNIPPVRIEIRPSKMLRGEIGLFATKPFKKDTIIAEASLFDECLVPWSDFKKLDPETQRKALQYCVQSPEGFYAPPDFNLLTVPWNMNHSCDYNVGFDKAGNFVSAKNIKAGDELVWDYGMAMTDPRMKLVCKCGSKNCRKVITGSDWRDADYRKKNRKYFVREVLDMAANL